MPPKPYTIKCVAFSDLPQSESFKYEDLNAITFGSASYTLYSPTKLLEEIERLPGWWDELKLALETLPANTYVDMEN